MKRLLRAVAGVCVVLAPFSSAVAITPSPSGTPTATPTSTSTKTPTPVSSPNPSPTSSGTPTKTPTPAPTVSTTPTSTPSATPSATPSQTPTATATPTPVATPCETEECQLNDAAEATEGMESSPEFTVFGSALDGLLAALEPITDTNCAIIRALESSLTRAMADSYCPGRCERDFPTQTVKRALCRSFCRRSIACYYTSFISSPVAPAVAQCLGHSQEDYDACIALAEEIARRAAAARAQP